MKRLPLYSLASLVFIQFIFAIPSLPPCFAQEWAVRTHRGTLKVVDLFTPTGSAMHNYAEGLVNVDKDNNWAPCLAEDWRWVDDRTIEFALRRGVTFHNGEKFNAEAVRVNWEQYRKMECPRPMSFLVLPDETSLKIIDEQTVRFTFPEPDGLAFVKFWWFFQFAPAFFTIYQFEERNWGYLPEAGPWGTGPFEFVEGKNPYAKPSDRLILDAYTGYWDRRYPIIKRLIFDNTLIANREEAMRRCMASAAEVDILNHIRPLDTLKVAESPFAKVVKSKDVSRFWGIINQRKTESRWRDVLLRKAINYAINREELWRYAAKGNAYNLGALFPPPGAYGHNPNLAPWTYDTSKARSLLADAGYPEGFDVNIVTPEAWKLEAQIISKMLERIGLKTRLDVLAWPEWLRKMWIPALEKPPEEQRWDISISSISDVYGHVAVSFFAWFLQESELRYSQYDPVYDEMWKDMARTVDGKTQEAKIRKMAEYVHDRALALNIYSPLTLYAVNKEVDFVPQKCNFLRLKEASVTENHWSIREENQQSVAD